MKKGWCLWFIALSLEGSRHVYHIKGRNGKLVLFEKHENSINWEFDQKQVPLKFEKEEGLEIASIVDGEIEVVLKKEDV